MNMWIMYLVLKLDDIQVGLGTACFLVLALLIFLRARAWFIFDNSCGEDNKKIYKERCKKLKKWYAIPVILFALCVFTPTSQTGAVLYVLPKILNNKQIQKMPDKLVTLANDWMDEQIKSIKTK